jgi:hypothetical protein
MDIGNRCVNCGKDTSFGSGLYSLTEYQQMQTMNLIPMMNKATLSLLMDNTGTDIFVPIAQFYLVIDVMK